jgi:serine/threonine protein kinase
MEFVEGRSIEDLVLEGPLPVGRALETTRQVLLALQHAHAAGVIHRDIKPENIMRVETDDGTWNVKVLDFGIAKAPTTGPGGQLTQAGVVFGTPQYMAPEQAMSATVDARADLYAAGATLWRMLTGKPLFDGEGPVEILTAKLSKPPPSLEQANPGVYSQRLVAFLDRALKRKPSERFASADEMVAELTRVQADLGGGLAIKPRGGTLKQLVDRGDQLRRQAVTTYLDWYNCAGSEGTPTWKLRLSTLATTRRGGIAAGLTLLALLLLFGVPLLQVAAIPDPDVTVAESARAAAEPTSKDPSWIRKILPTEPKDQKPRSPLPPALHKRMLRVRLLLEKGACSEASVDLKNLVGDRPNLAEGHYLLGAAEFCRRRHKAALDAYGQAIKLDPRYRRDVRILEHTKALLDRRGMRESAVAFIGAHLGRAALPVLIDAASNNKDLKARHLAITMVAKHGAASKIDWVSSLSLDLAQLPTCEERCKVVERLYQLGDTRAIPALRKARDAMIRYRIFRRRWKNACCRDRIIAVIMEFLKKQKGA